jgi:hypothetical protein
MHHGRLDIIDVDSQLVNYGWMDVSLKSEKTERESGDRREMWPPCG